MAGLLKNRIERGHGWRNTKQKLPLATGSQEVTRFARFLADVPGRLRQERDQRLVAGKEPRFWVSLLRVMFTDAMALVA